MSTRKKIDISAATAAKLTSQGNDSDLAYLKANGARALPSSPTAAGWSADAIKKQLYKQPEILFAWLKAIGDALETIGISIDDYLDAEDALVAHLAGDETITGKKTFTDNLKLGTSESDNSKTFDVYFTVNLRGPVTSAPILPVNLGFSLGSADSRWNTAYVQYLDVSQTIKQGSYAFTLPSKSGTFALVSDIDDEIDKIKDGTYIAKKAERDVYGNTITSTYETKADATAKVARANLVSILKVMGASGNQNSEGLFSATDKARLDTLFALLGEEEDADEVVNTIREVLAIFDQYPEGVTLANALALKVAIADIVDNLTTQDASKPLSANQGYVLKGLIDTINATIADYLVSVASIAPVYSPSETYQKGEKVVYGITLYRALQDISTAEAWTAAHWESVNVVDLIGEKITRGAREKDSTLWAGKADVAVTIETSTVRTQHNPYAAQTTAVGEDVAKTATLNKLVGVSLVKNQLAVVQSDSGTTSGITHSTSNGRLTLSGTNSDAEENVSITAIASVNAQPIYASHIYYVRWCIDGTKPNPSTDARNNLFGRNFGWDDAITSPASDGTTYTQVTVLAGSTVDFSTALKVHDLTKRYGNNDVVNAIIGSGTDEEKIANLLAFDPDILKDDDFDTGSFWHSKTKYLKCVGYNALKDVISVSGSSVAYVDKVLDYPTYLVAGTSDMANGGWALLAKTTAAAPYAELMDADGNVLASVALTEPRGSYRYGRFDLATPAIVGKIRFYYNSDKETTGSFYYQNVCAFLYWDGSKIAFEDYGESITELPNETLRGMLKVSGVRVVPDGDELYPDGTGKQNYGVYTFTGNENWVVTADKYWRIKVEDMPDGLKGIKNLTTYILIPGYHYAEFSDIYGQRDETGLGYSSSVGFYCGGYASGVSPRTALAGKTIIFKLNTPTPKTAATFNPQINVDNWGTMLFLDENGNVIAGMQGNETTYRANLSDFLDSLFNRASEAGEDGADELVTQDELETVDDKNDDRYAIMQENVGGMLRHQLAKAKSLNFNDTKAITLDSLTFTYYSSWGGFIAEISDYTNEYVAGTTKPNLYCSKYECGNYQEPSPCIRAWTGLGEHKILLIDSTLGTDPTSDTFNNGIKGIMLAYKKAGE